MMLTKELVGVKGFANEAIEIWCLESLSRKAVRECRRLHRARPRMIAICCLNDVGILDLVWEWRVRETASAYHFSAPPIARKHLIRN